jgi:Short C-terminal domain
MIIRRRGMPLLRGAIVGGAAYSMGRRAANSAQREQEQSAAIADLQAQYVAQPAAQAQYVAQPAPAQPAPAQPAPVQAGTDVASRLAQLSELLQQGVLTQDEFVQAKAKVLAG